MTSLVFVIPQLIVCSINVLGGIRFFKENDIFINEKKFIYTFCVIDLTTSIFGLLLFLDVISNKVIDYTYLTFLWSEITLLPAYLVSTIGHKPSWTFPISIVLLTFIISLFYIDLTISYLQIFSGIYVSYFCIQYLIWLFTNENIYEISHKKHFWITMGIMVCYTASIPSCIGYLLLTTLGETENDYHLASSLNWFFLLLNITMHLLFIKAFSWTRDQH